MSTTIKQSLENVQIIQLKLAFVVLKRQAKNKEKSKHKKT